MKKNILLPHVDRLAKVLDRLRQTAEEAGDQAEGLPAARVVVALDAAARKLAKLTNDLAPGLFNDKAEAQAQK
jgi:hypothetical protein